MNALARHGGDVDAPVRSHSRDLGAYRRLARRAGRAKASHARETDHPAAAIYRNAIDGIADHKIVDHKNNRTYDKAAALAGKIEALVQRAGEAKEFAEWLGVLREKHKAKRNFMQRIEGLK